MILKRGYNQVLPVITHNEKNIPKNGFIQALEDYYIFLAAYSIEFNYKITPKIKF